MSTTPPSIPPEIAASSVPDWAGFWSAFFAGVQQSVAPISEGNKGAIGALVAELFAVLTEVSIQLSSEIGKRVGASVDEWEATAGPEIMRAAAAGLSDLFGVQISPEQLAGSRSGGAREEFAEQLGRFVLESMFGAFLAPTKLDPDTGRDNAERLLGYNIGLAIEGWLGQVVTHAPLMQLIPGWDELDDIMSQTLGLGRATRRVMAPLLKTLVVDPFQWDLNRRFAPHRFSAAELVRLLLRGAIDTGTYHEQLSWLGYDQADAARLLQLAQRYPEKEDIAKMLELGILDTTRAAAIFRALGFSEEAADAMVVLSEEDRVRSINTAMESVGRDMFRDRDIDAAEYRSLLTSAGRAPQEVEQLLALGSLERARPRKLSMGDIESGFRRGLIPLSRLREYYSSLGFALEDQVLLEEMAVEDRLAVEQREEAAKLKAQSSEFRAVPRGQIERAYVEGLIPRARLAEWYTARRFAAADVALMLDLADGRKLDFDQRLAEELEAATTPAFRSLSRGQIEEAFLRDVIPASRLREWYVASGLAPGDVDVALELARQRKAERAERLAEQLERAARPDFVELPRSVMEEAFARGLVDETRLRAWYEARGFRADEIPILLELACEKRAARAAKPATP